MESHKRHGNTRVQKVGLVLEARKAGATRAHEAWQGVEHKTQGHVR